jgi:hypothetical protein|tara:strand:+ start:4014 stop:4514 length:501 start_codon:yes stop_codon:yes gene_type:complete
MSRTKDNAGQFLEAYILHASGKGRKHIFEVLNERYQDQSVSLRTIGTWLQRFRTMPEHVVAQDKEFEWHECEEYGIPWEASRLLMSLLEAYAYPPSARTAKWIWRISCVADWSGAPEKLLQLADMYTNHERELLFNGKTTFTFKDLNSEIQIQSSALRAMEGRRTS